MENGESGSPLLFAEVFLTLVKSNMELLKIDKKKFVVIEQTAFDKIQLRAARKTSPVKKLSLSAGKKHALKLIDKWSKEK